MWPFKSRIPVVKDIIFENEGQTITIIHEKGAHKFNKEEVLDAHFNSDAFSGPKLKLKDLFDPFYLLLLGGFCNLMFAIYPPYIWYALEKERLLSTLLTSNLLLNYFLLLSISIILALITNYIFNIFWRYGSYYDIANIHLNNTPIVFRIEYQEQKNKLIDFCIAESTKKPRKTNDYILIFFFYVFLTSLILIPLWNWDRPYLFWQFIENFLPNTFVSKHNDTFLFWHYYSDFDINSTHFIRHNINPFRAFFDGFYSVLPNIIIPLILILVFGFLFSSFCFGFPLYYYLNDKYNLSQKTSNEILFGVLCTIINVIIIGFGTELVNFNLFYVRLYLLFWFLTGSTVTIIYLIHDYKNKKRVFKKN